MSPVRWAAYKRLLHMLSQLIDKFGTVKNIEKIVRQAWKFVRENTSSGPDSIPMPVDKVAMKILSARLQLQFAEF